MAVKRRFLGWERPLLHLAGEALLTHRRAPGGLLDLSHLLVVVPTRHSGRRLREHLAQRADAAGTALLPPQVVTPESLVARAAEGVALADRYHTLAVWARVLQAAEPAACPALFPTLPAQRDFAWALGCASRFVQVAATLGEVGLRIGDVAAHPLLADDPTRWRDLARLDEAVHTRLAALGLEEPNAARARRVQDVSPPPGTTGVAVLGTPDPVPLALRVLERYAASVPVDLYVHAPEALADSFDDWGRPRTDAWSRRPVPLSDGDIRLVSSPFDQAREVVSLLDHGRPTADVAVVTPDPEVVPFLEKALAARDIPSYNPGGLSLRVHPVVHLLTLFSDLLQDESYEAFAALLRQPDYLARLRRDAPELNAPRLLAQLDRFQTTHLPSTVQDIDYHLAQSPEAYPSVRRARGLVQQDLATLRDARAGAGTLTLLSRVFHGRRLRPDEHADRVFQAAAEAVSQLLVQLDGAVFDALALTRTERFLLLREALQGMRFHPERQPESVDLIGWLEAHWDDAPHLVVTGMNDGMVPETLIGDPFLPDSLRAALGLRSNESRFARDAYLLRAMLAGRAAHGSLTVVLGKRSESSDPRKPSRLLFLCTDEELPARTARLFGDVEAPEPRVRRELTWRLQPPAATLPTRVSVTGLRAYLACPFRFYLERLVRMEEADDRATEMDAGQFGSLCHAALEAFGRDPGARESADADFIAAWLDQALDGLARAQFGPAPPAPIRIQLESARQRLRFAAREQAAQRADGWHIVATEHRLGGDEGLALAGLAVTGIVDRIDRHEDGRVRLLDYKTADNPGAPARKHLATATEETPGWMTVEYDGKRRRWVDLQLPLYRHFLRAEYGAHISAGYFHLPKAVTATAVEIWEELDDSLTADAVRCATAVIEAIRARRFWPPAQQVPFDMLEGLVFAPAEEAFDGEAFAAALAAGTEVTP